MQTQKTILLVEDEIELNELLTLELEDLGYEVLSAFDGVQASEILQTVKVDGIITDLFMPRLDGIGLIEYIRQHKITTPLLVLSASKNQEIMEKLTELKAIHFVEKPINEMKIRLIKHWLECLE